MNHAKLRQQEIVEASGLCAMTGGTPAIVLTSYWAHPDLDCLFARSPDDPMTMR